MKLVVIINDILTDIIKKGELTARYYNPGNLFDEVHIILINDDLPSKEILQKLVGTAKLYLYNYPANKKLFFKSFGWRPFLLKRWVIGGVNLIRFINPNLIRCHDDQLNGLIAEGAKFYLGIPYVVSMHCNPEEDIYGRLSSIKHKILYLLMSSVKKKVLRNADLVLPVYEAIIPYLNRMGVKNIQVAYNFLNSSNLKIKLNYELNTPIKLICVGRQIPEKNPENIIKALSQIQNASLTLIGDGPINSQLKLIAANLNISNRVFFIDSIENDNLCKMLCDFDIFVTHSEFWEISKSVLEPLLVGLPVIINARIGEKVPEFNSNFIMTVPNSKEGYASAINKLIIDNKLRKNLGLNAHKYSQERWSPKITENVFVSIYKNLTNRET